MIWLIWAGEVETGCQGYVYEELMKGWPQVKGLTQMVVNNELSMCVDQVGSTEMTCINHSSYAQVYSCSSGLHTQRGMI